MPPLDAALHQLPVAAFCVQNRWLMRCLALSGEPSAAPVVAAGHAPVRADVAKLTQQLRGLITR